MNIVLIRNGTAYPVQPFTRVNSNGFDKISCIVKEGAPASVLYSVGSLHWALPNELYDAATVKKQRGNRGILITTNALDRAAFLASLPI